MRLLLGFTVFLGLCWGAFLVKENHQSTAYKSKIEFLEQNVYRLEVHNENLRCEIRKVFPTYPECQVGCPENTSCNEVTGLCFPEEGSSVATVSEIAVVSN